MKCLRCKQTVKTIGAESYTLDGDLNGYYCNHCATRKPKYRKGITGADDSAKGRPKGHKRRRFTPEALEEVFGQKKEEDDGVV